MLASSLSRSYWHRERRPSLLRHCTDSATPPPGRRCGQQGNHHIRSFRMPQTPLQLCFVRTLLPHTWWSRLASLDEKLWPVAEYWILGLKPKPATTILLHNAATTTTILLLYYAAPLKRIKLATRAVGQSVLVGDAIEDRAYIIFCFLYIYIYCCQPCPTPAVQ